MAGERISACTQVYTSLLHEIQEGVYPPGDKLPSENELVERFHISRNTVRGAIDRLAALGLVQTFQGKGTFVREVSQQVEAEAMIPSLFGGSGDFLSVMRLRIAVEVEAAAAACVAASLQQLQELEAIVLDLERHVENLEYFAKNDIMYHSKIAEASGNRLFSTILQMIRGMLDGMLADFIVEYGNYESVHSHRKILECIKLADPEGARLYMRKHLEVVLSRFSIIENPK